MLLIPGEYRVLPGAVELLAGREAVEIMVGNTGDRPVQVGSHFHFYEVNRGLVFDREKAFGMRLFIPAGTAVRFEPGEEKPVLLVELGGNRIAMGMNGLVNGPAARGGLDALLRERLREWKGGAP